MIDRAEILAVATDLGLRADVVEKDYILGWMLAAISRHDVLGKSWSFKGGTCLKKCYLETYRFSEDLDFTVSEVDHLQEPFLQAVFAEIAGRLYDEVGIEIPAGQARFELFHNKREKLSCQGRIYYRSPLQRGGDLQRLKLDLTVDEILVLPPVERPIHHPYSDGPPGGMTARCYAFVEVFAEKIRALAERTRPRDLYDVVNLFRSDLRPSPSDVAAVLEKLPAVQGGAAVDGRHSPEFAAVSSEFGIPLVSAGPNAKREAGTPPVSREVPASLLAGCTGLEPVASGVTGRRYIRLN